MASPDRRTVILIEESNEDPRLEIFRVVYGDEVGLDCVAVRPIKIFKNIDSGIVLATVYSTTAKMNILARSELTTTKNGVASNWYKIQYGNTAGWVLGINIDTLDPAGTRN